MTNARNGILQGRNLFLLLLISLLMMSLIWPRIGLTSSQTVYDFSTDSGLNRVYYVYDAEADKFSGNLTVHLGEVQSDGLRGLAHYLEHLVYLDGQRGANLSNASHSNAHTNFFTTSYVQEGVDAEPILDFFSGVFEVPDIGFDAALGEIKVIEQERRVRAPETKNHAIFLDSFVMAFDDPKFGQLPIGTRASIEQFTPDAAYRLHERFYDPVNADLVLYGPLSPRKMRKLIGQYFASLPSDADKKIDQPSPIATPARLRFTKKRRCQCVIRALCAK